MPRVLFVGKRRKLGVHYYLLNCGKNYARATVVLSSLSRPELGETVGGAGKHDVFFTTLAAVSTLLLLLLLFLLNDDDEEAAGWKLTLDTALACAFGIRVG